MIYDAFAIFVKYPWLAAIPAVLFYLLFRRFRSKLVLAASILWAAYMIYEMTIWSQILCSEDCSIRVDLVLIFPLLLVISILAFAKMFLSVYRQTPNADKP